MTRRHRLDPVAALARHRQHLAEKSFGQAQAALQARRQTLAQLQLFRDDYDRTDRTTLATGMSAAALQDYQQFLQRLDQAIAQQQTEIAQAEAAMAGLREALRSATTRAESLDLAIAHQRERIERLQRNGEQKLLDELAARAGRRSP